MAVTGDVGTLEAIVRRQIWGQVSDFRLQIRADGIVLRGRAPTYYLKQLAQHVALEVSHLPLAANEIEVAGPA